MIQLSAADMTINSHHIDSVESRNLTCVVHLNDKNRGNNTSGFVARETLLCLIQI